MSFGYKDSDYKYDIGGGLGIRGRPVTRTVTIDSGARDGGTAGGNAATELRPGCVLGVLTASGRYTDFDYDGSDGTENEEDCVILAEKVPDISTGNQQALVYAAQGVFNWDTLRWATSDDKTNVEREKLKFAFYNVT